MRVLLKRGEKKALVWGGGGFVITHIDTKGFSARRDSVPYRNTCACNRAAQAFRFSPSLVVAMFPVEQNYITEGESNAIKDVEVREYGFRGSNSKGLLKQASFVMKGWSTAGDNTLLNTNASNNFQSGWKKSRKRSKKTTANM